METETRPATNGDHAAAPPFHIHAAGLGQQVNVSIPSDAAEILLNMCKLPGVGQHLQTSQSKLQAGYAQQVLEAALGSIKAELPAEAPTDDDAANEPAEP